MAKLSHELALFRRYLYGRLQDVLARIPRHPNRRRAELLPRQWKAARTAVPL